MAQGPAAAPVYMRGRGWLIHNTLVRRNRMKTTIHKNPNSACARWFFVLKFSPAGSAMLCLLYQSNNACTRLFLLLKLNPMWPDKKDNTNKSSINCKLSNICNTCFCKTDHEHRNTTQSEPSVALCLKKTGHPTKTYQNKRICAKRACRHR